MPIRLKNCITLHTHAHIYKECLWLDDSPTTMHVSDVSRSYLKDTYSTKTCVVYALYCFFLSETKETVKNRLN